MKKIIVAIDGFSSCGKSTMAKNLASEIGYVYIDTGAMYRAFTLYALRKGFYDGEKLDISGFEKVIKEINVSFKVNPQTGTSETYLNGINVEKEIRGMKVANLVSKVASLSFVRETLVEEQRRMGICKGVVMDGRDIGTVVFPQAELKIFVTASPEIRASRRLKEMKAKGETVSFEEVLENVKKRDEQDMKRTISPLKKANDAIELDNTNMTIPEQEAWLLAQYKKVLNNDSNRDR